MSNSPASPDLKLLQTGAKDSGKRKGVNKPVVIGMTAFPVRNFMTAVSLRGLSAQAQFGLVSIFCYLFAAVVFLVPTALGLCGHVLEMTGVGLVVPGCSGFLFGHIGLDPVSSELRCNISAKQVLFDGCFDHGVLGDPTQSGALTMSRPYSAANSYDSMMRPACFT